MGHYEVLGVPAGVDADAVRGAYKRLALKHHPDKNPGDAGAEARFVAVSEAFRVLSDAGEREKYDREQQRARPPPRRASEPAGGPWGGGPWDGPGAYAGARPKPPPPPPRRPKEAGDMKYEGMFRRDVPGFNRGRPGVPRPREANGRARASTAGGGGAAGGAPQAGDGGEQEAGVGGRGGAERKTRVPNTSGWSHRRSYPEAYDAQHEDGRQAALRAAMARAEKAARMAKEAARRRAESMYGPAFGPEEEDEGEDEGVPGASGAEAGSDGADKVRPPPPSDAFVRERAAEMQEDTEAFLERLRRSKEQWDEEMRRERENLVMRQREAWDGMERGGEAAAHYGRRSNGFGVGGGRGRAAMERERAAAAAEAAARQDAASAAAAMGPAAAAGAGIGGGGKPGPGGMMRLSNVLRDMVNKLPEGLRQGTSFRTRVQRRVAGDPTGVTSQAKIASVWVSRDGRFLHWRFAATQGHAPDGGMDVPRVQRVRLLRPRGPTGSDAGVTGRSNRLSIECEGEDVGMHGVRPIVTLLLEHSREDDGCAIVETWASAFGEYSREAKRLILLAS